MDDYDMTRQQYKTMTETTRAVVGRLPLGEKLLKVPTLLCAAIYLCTLGWLFFNRDGRFWRAAVVPAVCFVTVTVLRPIINRQRPFDYFDLPPVGKWEKGKGKSMPSRHTVSAVAIAIAIAYVFPNPAVIAGMTVLGLLIAALRVLSGKHFVSDVAAAVVLAAGISMIGYLI